MAASKQQRLLFSDLAFAAFLDGDWQPEDVERLARYGRQIGLTANEVLEVMQEVEDGKKTEIAEIADEGLRRVIFEKYVKLILVDGEVSENDLFFLQQMAAVYGMSDDEVKATVTDAVEQRRLLDQKQ